MRLNAALEIVSLTTDLHRLPTFDSLWQLLYQTFVFVSRSSLSILHLPPLPLALLPLPTILQVAILVVTTFESATSFLVALFGEHGATWCMALRVCCEGLCGGAAYVNAFHRLATDSGEDQDDDDDELAEEEEIAGLGKSKARKDQEKEFVRLPAPLSAQRLLASSSLLISTHRICNSKSRRSGTQTRSALLARRSCRLRLNRCCVEHRLREDGHSARSCKVSLLWVIHHQDSVRCSVKSECGSRNGRFHVSAVWLPHDLPRLASLFDSPQLASTRSA